MSKHLSPPTSVVVLLAASTTLPLAAARAADTGDAPESYGQATHAVVAGAPRLGAEAPDDNDPVAGPGADGDDASGIDDEDGVVAFPVLVEDAKAYGVDVRASNAGATPATLIGWVDFDGDGRFSADEAASDTVPAGTKGERFKLRWNAFDRTPSDYSGITYARFRITTDPLAADSPTGDASDGEVEDYALEILADGDGDATPDRDDEDNDNDGIPDTVEVVGTDSDGDGIEDYLDSDSDGDGVPDFVEAGPDPARPVDSDGDGRPDYLDLDSDNDGRLDGEPPASDADGDGLDDELEGRGDPDGDGIASFEDLDSDNDLLPDAIEAAAGAAPAAGALDSDGDGAPDYLDLDSDNDGITDLLEAAGGAFDAGALDVDGDGRVDDGRPVGVNGLADAAETEIDSGVLVFTVVDTDGDGLRDYLDRDADGDGVADVVEGGGGDADADGVVDVLRDGDGDGLPDEIDVDATGGVDADGDGIDDAADADAGTGVREDRDGDGIADVADADADGDGVADALAGTLPGATDLPDTDADGVPDFRDPDAIGGGGTTAGDDGAGTTGGDGATTGDGTTGGGTTSGDGTGTTGGTTGGDGATTGDGSVTAGDGGDRPRDDDSPARRVETGLSGAAGCSVVGTAPRDPLLPAFALGAALLLGLRRREGARVREATRNENYPADAVKSFRRVRSARSGAGIPRTGCRS